APLCARPGPKEQRKRFGKQTLGVTYCENMSYKTWPVRSFERDAGDLPLCARRAAAGTARDNVGRKSSCCVRLRSESRLRNTFNSNGLSLGGTDAPPRSEIRDKLRRSARPAASENR